MGWLQSICLDERKKIGVKTILSPLPSCPGALVPPLEQVLERGEECSAYIRQRIPQ